MRTRSCDPALLHTSILMPNKENTGSQNIFQSRFATGAMTA